MEDKQKDKSMSVGELPRVGQPKQATRKPAEPDAEVRQVKLVNIAIELPVYLELDFAGYIPERMSSQKMKALHARLSSRQGKALLCLLEGFDRTENSPHGRPANKQDWLRSLLDKVADVIDGAAK